MTTAKVDWREFITDDPKLAEMHTEAQRFADELKCGMPPRWLTFTGKPGVGKTHLARCVYRWFDDRGCYYTEPTTGARLARSCAFAKWRQVASDILAGDWNLLGDFIDRNLLVLDDIGAEHQGASSVTHSALERLLDDRLGKWTILTTNLPHKDIAASLGARIASRLIRDGNVIVDAKEVRDFNLRRKAA